MPAHAADHPDAELSGPPPPPPSTGLAIAVVEDYDPLCRQIVEHLRREGHRVHGVDCGEALDELLRGFTPQLLVLDLNLPLEDGLSIAQRMRRAYPDVGIVMLSVRRTSAEREQGFRQGADIYLPKPLQPSELSAAIAALRRRLPLVEAPPQPWRLEALSRRLIAPARGTVSLTAFEAAALQAFARAPGQRLHRESLLEALAGEGLTPAKESLEVGFSRLRAKLAAQGIDLPLVKAVRGWGYQCCVPLVLSEPGAAATTGA